MTIDELLATHKITIPSTAEGSYSTICPACSHKRKSAHQKLKVLGVKIDAKGVTWHCSHCDWSGPPKRSGQDQPDIVAHEYSGPNGERLRKVRNTAGSGPRFWWQHWNGHKWAKGTNGAKPMLFRHDEVGEHIELGNGIAVVEGESDANALWAIGIPATTSPDGAAEPGKKPKWRKEYSEMLRGADVIVTGDDDAAGRAHIEVTASMLTGVAERVRVADPKCWRVRPNDKDVRDAINAGMTREQIDALFGQATEFRPSEPQPTKNTAPKKRATGKDIRTMTFSQIKFLVPGLIPSEGITLICAKPKVGKSWLLLDLAIAATMDRFTLGELKPTQGDVLYLALEDSFRRIQSRMTKLLPTFTGEWPEHLTFATEWRRVDQGGLDDIRDWANEVKAAGRNISFIAVDVLKMLRPTAKKGQAAYDADYEAITGLHNIAIELAVPIIVVHHTRKAEAEDLIDKVSGTAGLTGAVDTIIVIERQSQGTVFDVRGRDVEADTLAVEFNKDTCRWTILGSADTVHRSNERARILGIFQDATEPLAPKAVTELVNCDTLGKPMSHDAVRQMLVRMAKNGDLVRLEAGKYTLPAHPESHRHRSHSDRGIGGEL
jgi:hypothetical protein